MHSNLYSVYAFIIHFSIFIFLYNFKNYCLFAKSVSLLFELNTFSHFKHLLKRCDKLVDLQFYVSNSFNFR